MNRARACTIAFILTATALALACGGRDAPPRTPAAPSEEAQGASPAAPAPTSPVAETTTSAATPDDAMGTDHAQPTQETRSISTTALTDEQVLEVAHVANQAEIEQAKLAQQKAKDARVKKFAAMMVKDHRDADAKGTVMAKRNRWTLTESPVSAALKMDGDVATQQLKASSGAEFDRAYMTVQVKAHQDVLDTIDRTLMPSTQSEELRTMLENVRTKVAGHLKEAQDLVTSLGT